MIKTIACCAALAVLATIPARAATPPPLGAALKADLARYLADRGKIERISVASLSVNLKVGQPNINAVAGRVSLDPGSALATPENLFQIGSNTKAFTAVTILQLEAAGKLSIDDTLGKYLPQYPVWKNVTIRHLLDMTSPIPSYDNDPAVMGAYAKAPTKDWSAQYLVSAVYANGHPKKVSGWSYSNTNYLLAQMIIERVTGHSLAAELKERFFTPALGLTDTYYDPDQVPQNILDRMVQGYFYSNDPDNASLASIYGKGVKAYSLSWAQGAGGIISSPEQLTRWVRALYQSPLIPAKQRAEMMTIVSNNTGKPISKTSASDPRGFGLGVGQITAPKVGMAWYYEGETLGYRTVYAWVPKTDVVIAIGLNSQPNAKEDTIGKLLTTVYDTLEQYHAI